MRPHVNHQDHCPPSHLRASSTLVFQNTIINPRVHSDPLLISQLIHTQATADTSLVEGCILGPLVVGDKSIRYKNNADRI